MDHCPPEPLLCACGTGSMIPYTDWALGNCVKGQPVENVCTSASPHNTLLISSLRFVEAPLRRRHSSLGGL